ncbi:TonB-dependent receptor plug domain-containing protein [Azonexus sp.]|uniref:TonB-dependent receptor plug domain-containing protein n=1 Tax=Azonexus sp. TaxID=1872668 RepID=UPI0035AE7797
MHEKPRPPTRCLRLSALLAGIGVAAPLAAAEPQVFALGEIQVVATPAGEESLGASQIELEDIRQHDKRTVGTALDLLPGVTGARFGARNEQTASIRGFDLRQVPVFIDGIPIYVPYDGYVDLGRFTTFDLSRIEVARGFSSMVYGPNTLGGAINLISRRPAAAFEGEIGGGFGFDDNGSANGYHSYTNLGTNQGNWYAQIGASYLEQDHYALPGSYVPSPGEAGGRRDNSDHTDRKLNLKLGLTPNATDEYAINFISQHGQKGTPPYAGRVAGIMPRYWRWPYWDKDSVYLLTNTAIGEHRLKFRAYHDTFRNSLFSYDDATYTTQTKKYAFQSWYDDYTDGFSVEGEFRLADGNQLKTAFHYKEDVHREHDRGQPVRHFRDRTQSFNLEDSQRLGERLSLVAGLGYDTRKTLQAEDYNSSTGIVSDFARGDKDATNAQIGLRYRLSPSGLLSASIARKSRFPTIKERYSYKLGSAIPNAGLESEEATHFEVGYSDRLGSRWTGEARVFYSDVDNLIQSTVIAAGACSNPNPNCTQNQNVARSSAAGLELGAHGELRRNLELDAAYSFLDRRNRGDDGLQLTDSPRHKLFAALIWRPTGPLTLSSSVNAMSGRYSSSDGRQRAPGFAVFNLKAGYRFAGGLLVEAGVYNLFDRLYTISEGYPEAGRGYFTQFNLPL